ncbi:MAG: hypothetical protein AABZ57_07875 [Candidatus Margulisiibacteriota bacterium]
MTGITKIGKESNQEVSAKKTKSDLDILGVAKEEICKQFPGFSSYHAMKLAKLLTEKKDIIK